LICILLSRLFLLAGAAAAAAALQWPRQAARMPPLPAAWNIKSRAGLAWLRLRMRQMLPLGSAASQADGLAPAARTGAK